MFRFVSPMTKRKTTNTRAADVASFWCVHLRTAQRWLAEPGRAKSPPTPPLAALEDPQAMVAWFCRLPSASQSKSTATFRARIDAFRIALERGQPIEKPPGRSSETESPADPATPRNPSFTDPDYEAFLAERAARAATKGPGDGPAHRTLDSLKLRFDFADYKIGLAQSRGLHAEVREWTDTAARLAGVIHDEELRADKLGRELGDTLPRVEVERILRALPFWTLRAIDDLLATLCPAIAARSASPLFPEEVRQLIEPHLISAHLLAPYVRASQVNAGTALPTWAVAALRSSLAATLEDAESVFAALYATPVPAQPTPAPSS